MTSEEPLVLGDIVDDLVLIISAVDGQVDSQGSASYESVQRQVSDSLRLHLLSYIRFLEGASYVTYDRISDEMRVTAQGQEIRSRPQDLRAPAQEAFGDHITEEQDGEGEGEVDAFSEMFDEMADEMNSALDGTSFEEDENHEEHKAQSSGIDVFSSPQQEEVQTGGEIGPGQAAAAKEPVVKEEPMNYESNAPVAEPGWSTSTQGSSMNEEAFERIEELGSGGIGTVYRGRQVRLDREVAIKEIREIFSVFAGVQRDDILERFRSIVKTQASLLHPNIIQLVDVDTSGEFPFSVMQLAPNGNLRRLIEHGERPPLAVSLKYFLQILHALNTAHDQGVVHGSLKPENVVLDQAGNAMVTDFGISRIVEREGGRGNQVYVGVGSVAYMSPEQFQDPNLATIKSDIYSLGIMLYEMLTGKVPGRRSPMPSSFFPDIPRALDDIFDRMSMDREEDRYDSIEAIIADVYGAEKVLAILDKRSGVLFLRDPITHGASGLGEDVEAAPAQPQVEEQPPESGWDQESEADSVVEEESEVEVQEEVEDDGDDFGDDVDAQKSADDNFDEDEVDSEEADEDEGEEEAEDIDGDDDDVLGKLDKYGELFEED